MIRPLFSSIRFGTWSSIVLSIALALVGSARGGERVIKLFLDADMSNLSIAGNSIELGIHTALSEAGGRIHGFPVQLIVLDHRGNVVQSKSNVQQIIADPDALAIFSGLHSQPLLVWKKFIGDQRIPVLDPWAAAGPITRQTNSRGENWFFRLSVDDLKAGEFLVKKAVDEEKFQRPALVLDDTSWGKTNEKTITEGLARRRMAPAAVLFFNWKIGEYGLHKMLDDVFAANADVVILVCNPQEGKAFIKAMGERKDSERLPVRSHWGITGGNFYDPAIAQTLKSKVNLEVLQTSFSFLHEPLSPQGQNALNAVRKISERIRTGKDIQAPTGFIHGYDLTRLLLAAAEQVEWSDDMQENRNRLRLKLESLDTPVMGLIKEYRHPFSAYTPDNSDAHEALGLSDLRMGFYNPEGDIELVPNQN